MQIAARAVAALAVLAMAAPAFAQDERMTPSGRSQFQPEAQQQTATVTTGRRTVKAMLADGYEIKTLSVIPRAIVVGAGSTSDIDAALIVMQKGGVLANCYFSFTSLVDGTYYGGTESCLVLE
jgi:hypothetical protein